MNLEKSIEYLSRFIKMSPDVCIILGSGLDNFTELISEKITIPYNDIPTFYQTSVQGHKGEFIYGKINNNTILCAKGRFHYYEGYTFNQVGSLIEIFNHFNPKLSIITNSSGCLNTNWDIGSLMISNKIIDFSFINSTEAKEHLFEEHSYFKLAKDIAKINKIVISWSKLKLTSVAIKIIAINTHTNRAETVVNAIAQCVHLERLIKYSISLLCSILSFLEPSFNILYRSTILESLVAITAKIAPIPVSRKAGATAS